MAGQPSRQGQPHPGFGYDFYQEAYSDHPPELPSSNEPLLNTSENSFLSSFYGQQQGHLGQPQDTPNSFAINQNLSAEEIQWLMNDPPPQIHTIGTTPMPVHTPPAGHSQTLSSQNIGLNYDHHGTNDISINMSNGEIMNAATILSQPLHQQPVHMQHIHNQSAAPYHSPHHTPSHQQSAFQPPDPASTTTIEPIHTAAALVPMSSPTPAHSMQPPSSIISQMGHLIPMPRLDTSQATLSQLSHEFVAPHTAPPLGRNGPNPRLYHFGSDASFNPNGYRPTFQSESHEAREELLTSELRRLKPINRTPNVSRPTTPEQHIGNGSRKRRLSDASNGENGHHDFKRPRASPSSPAMSKQHRSRRRSSLPQLPNIPSSSTPTSSTRPTAGRRRSSPPASANSRNAKREHLNDEQKRQNHIMSEQKRRNQIRLGFEELHKLVPELREGGLSKSNVLMETAAFLEAVVTRNKEIRRRMGLPEPPVIPVGRTTKSKERDDEDIKTEIEE